MIELSAKTVMEVQHGNYGLYLAIGRKLPTTRLRWIFLSPKAVHAIDTEKIDAFLKGHKTERLQLWCNQYAVVCFHADRPFVGFHRIDADGSIISGKGMNINIDEWAELAAHLPILCIHVNATSLLQYKQTGSDSLWHFLPQEFGYDNTRHVALPSPSELMGLLYRWQVCRDINKKMREHCPGCKNDSPGQRDHMGSSGNLTLCCARMCVQDNVDVMYRMLYIYIIYV